MDNNCVIIAGAGIVGLTLSQALKKRGIPFRIFERDETPTARSQGWAITLHWALDYLAELVDDEALRRIEAVQVDPENALNDQGNFLFLDLSDCSVKFKIPPSKRWRVNREKTRQALLVGIEEHVEWGKRVDSVELPSSGGVRVTFEGGSCEGRLLVGADGSNSAIRKFLAPSTHQNEQLPFRFTGVAVDMTPDQVKPLRDLDPLLFQGLHAPTRTFVWVSTLETPTVNKSKGGLDEHYRVQLNMSWPVEKPEDGD